MDASQLEHALTQTLENYQRCGVRQFNRIGSDSLPGELLTAVEAMAQSSFGTLSAADKSEVTDPNKSKPSLANSNTASTATPAGEPADGKRPAQANASEWELPVLDEMTRRTEFENLDPVVKACRECTKIVDYRRQTVFGVGNLKPTICFMGEAPGADEDRLGEPFVGRAGQLLNKIIAAMKLKREDVYILNALKCRPPQNRTPLPDEIENCRHFAEKQLSVLQPKYLVCLGAVAVRSVLQRQDSIGRLRGRFHSYQGAKVVVTYHPSYLLRNESAKRLVWDDMKMLMQDLGIEL